MVCALLVVFLVPALLTVAALPVIGFESERTAPVSYAGPAANVRMMTGAAAPIIPIRLIRRHVERRADTTRVRLGESRPAGSPGLFQIGQIEQIGAVQS
ncbi:MAG: hypothetical protein QOC85_1 [Streptomyces sp.]|nr:hypothetical protein [Streptomyces sp.]